MDNRVDPAGKSQYRPHDGLLADRGVGAFANALYQGNHPFDLLLHRLRLDLFRASATDLQQAQTHVLEGVCARLLCCLA